MYHVFIRYGWQRNGESMTDSEREVVYVTVFTVIVMFVLAISMMLFATRGHAHDASHPEHDEWYKELRRPDNPPDHPDWRCCGIQDAYWADVIRVRDGKVYATITDDREDAPLQGRHHVPFGKEIEVPNEKLTWKEGNPTGHAIIFLTVNDDVLCYVQNSGT